MKTKFVTKSFFVLIILFVSFISTKAQFYDLPKMNTPQDFHNNGYYRVAVVLRHHPFGQGTCTCPKCKCPSCSCPVGICICTNAQTKALGDTESLTQDDIDEGYGSLWVKVSHGQIHMIFEVPNDEHGDMVINSDPVVDNTDAPKMGASSAFQISNGTFTLIKTKYTYGEIVINITSL